MYLFLFVVVVAPAAALRFAFFVKAFVSGCDAAPEGLLAATLRVAPVLFARALVIGLPEVLALVCILAPVFFIKAFIMG